MFQKILVGLDQTEDSQNVFDKALELAKLHQAQLLLVHVVSPIDEGYPTPVYVMPDSLYPMQHEAMLQGTLHQFSALEKLGLEMLRSRQATATAAGVASEFCQPVGEPGSLICQTAHSWQADVIVMGRRERSGLSEWILGSVSNYVMHHAPCSVLIVQDAFVTA
jgi:nucleotide-binding universal stress UspA family protein